MDRREKLDDIEESLRLAMEAQQANIWTALPGIVQSVNLGAQTLTVQPSIQGVITGADNVKRSVNLPLLVDVPIVWPRAGGFALTFPIASGDEVLVIFSSRCIDAWWQSGGIGTQAEMRMHDLSDGFAVLAPTSQPRKLSGVSSSNVQLRNDAGTTFLEITPNGRINLTASSQINLTAPQINMTGQLSITGGMTQSGNVAFAGGTLTHNGKNIGSTHTHSGVTPGGGNTGAPN